MESKRGVSKLVVGVDGSEQARAAMGWAIRMAKGMGSEVVAVYGIAPPVYFDTGFAAASIPVQYDAAWRADIQKEFEQDWCKPLKDAGITYSAVMDDGRPASVIIAVADKVNADIVLVGRRGRGGVAELLLGSVSHELVLHCKRPVLVISGPPA